MNWLVVDAGSRFVRAAGLALGRSAVLRDLRRRQQLSRPSRFVACDDDAYLFWAAVDVASVKRVETDLNEGLLGQAAKLGSVSDGVMAAALARLCAEFRVEFSCDPEGIAVIAPHAVDGSTLESATDFRTRLERACAQLGVRQCHVVEPMSALAQSAGSRDHGTDLVVDWGASGIRVGLVDWRSGEPLARPAQLVRDSSGARPGSHEQLSALWQDRLGSAASPDTVQWLADETLRPGQVATRVEFKAGQPSVLAVSDFLKHQLRQGAESAAERLLQRWLMELDGLKRPEFRVILAGGGAEALATRWGNTPGALGEPSNVGPMAALTGALEQIRRWPVPGSSTFDEIGWMVPRSRLSRGGGRPMDDMDRVPVLKSDETVGRYSGPGCGWLSPEATLYARRGDHFEHFTLPLPQEFQVAESPWVEATLIGICGSAIAIALRTHLGTPARHFVLSNGQVHHVSETTRRWIRNQHAP
jgi:hypothetical protein